MNSKFRCRQVVLLSFNRPCLQCCEIIFSQKTVKACVKCAPLRGHGMMWWWERCGPPAEVGGLPEAQKSAFQGPWLTACLFEGPRGCWDYFRLYVAPALSDLNRISSSIKGGLLRITFIAFQVILETCKRPPKNWISGSELSFREIWRICHRRFKGLKF